MTTQIHILNPSDSNHGQHIKVTFTRKGDDPKVSHLAPGESKALWVSDTDDVHVTEIFAPKAKK